MRRIIISILIIALCMTCLSTSFAASKLPDISKLSEAELLELRDKINARLDELRESKDILYDDKDITIKWLGFNTDFSPHIKNSLLITNKMNKSVYYGVTKISYNGIQVTAANSFMNMEIEAGMSYLTATNNLNLVDLGGLEAVGIKTVGDITDVYLEVCFYKSDDFGAKAFKTCKLRFTVE